MRFKREKGARLSDGLATVARLPSHLCFCCERRTRHRLYSAIPSLQPRGAPLISPSHSFFSFPCRSSPQASIEYLHLKPRVSLYVILIGSSLAFCYNISSFYLTKVTSALTLTVTSSSARISLRAPFNAIIAVGTNPIAGACGTV